MSIPSDIPKEAIPILQEMGYLEADRLHIGDASPTLTLMTVDGRDSAMIGAPGAPLPTVLIFGSYT